MPFEYDGDYVIKCNKCDSIFQREEDLELMLDKDETGEEWFWGCPICKTDEYLMNRDRD